MNECAKQHLQAISNKLSILNYALFGTVYVENIAHGKKSDFCMTLSSNISSLCGYQLILKGGAGFPTELFVIHIYMMNVLYQTPLRLFKSKHIYECMMNTMVRKLCGLLNSSNISDLFSVFLHFDTPTILSDRKS